MTSQSSQWRRASVPVDWKRSEWNQLQQQRVIGWSGTACGANVLLTSSSLDGVNRPSCCRRVQRGSPDFTDPDAAIKLETLKKKKGVGERVWV